MPVMQFLERRLGVEAEVDVPDDLYARERLVPSLGYPAELISVSNKKLPQTGRSDGLAAWPRVQGLGADGFLLWVTVGDYAFDAEAPELTGPRGQLDDEQIRARKPQRVDFVPQLSERDNGGPRAHTLWPDTYLWSREVIVSERHYVMLYAFVSGTTRFEASNRPPDKLGQLVGSMSFRDYS